MMSTISQIKTALDPMSTYRMNNQHLSTNRIIFLKVKKKHAHTSHLTCLVLGGCVCSCASAAAPVDTGRYCSRRAFSSASPFSAMAPRGVLTCCTPAGSHRCVSPLSRSHAPRHRSRHTSRLARALSRGPPR